MDERERGEFIAYASRYDDASGEVETQDVANNRDPTLVATMRQSILCVYPAHCVIHLDM